MDGDQEFNLTPWTGTKILSWHHGRWPRF